MSPEIRRSWLCAFLRARPHTIAELARALAVPRVVVRNDLNALADQMALHRERTNSGDRRVLYWLDPEEPPTR